MHVDSCNINENHLSELKRLLNLKCIIARDNNIRQLTSVNANLKYLDVSCNNIDGVLTDIPANNIKCLVFGSIKP